MKFIYNSCSLIFALKTHASGRAEVSDTQHSPRSSKPSTFFMNHLENRGVEAERQETREKMRSLIVLNKMVVWSFFFLIARLLTLMTHSWQKYPTHWEKRSVLRLPQKFQPENILRCKTVRDVTVNRFGLDIDRAWNQF